MGKSPGIIVAEGLLDRLGCEGTSFLDGNIVVAAAIRGDVIILTVHRAEKIAQRLEQQDSEIKRLQAIADRPLDDDCNVLLNRCEAREPLSLADQRQLYDWLEERGQTIADYEDKIQELEAALAKES